MAAACTAMEIHDRRLSISKASASKISKPSPSSVLKSLSASAASASSPSSSPPRQLPCSITSSPSRPISKVVTADPSSFRRVVQELTGTTPSPSSSNAGTSPRVPSRLQRIAPPPLRATLRADHPPPHLHSLLEQMQQQHQASQMLLLQQNIPKVGPHSPALSFTEVSTSSSNVSTAISKPDPQIGNPNSNHGAEQAFQFGNSNPNFSQSLPMLSPHLLSPLPALTPGDSTWANPIEMIGHSPKFTANSLPPLLPLPNLASSTSSNNGYGNGVMQRPAYENRIENDGMLTRPAHFMANSLATAYGQPQSLPPLLSTPLQTPSCFNGVLPPWSPSPLPFSPGAFPVSPVPGLPPAAATTPATLVSNAQFNTHIRYGSVNPSMPNNNFTF